MNKVWETSKWDWAARPMRYLDQIAKSAYFFDPSSQELEFQTFGETGSAVDLTRNTSYAKDRDDF